MKVKNDTITFNSDGLDQLMKAFKGDLPKVRVGVLAGAKTSRNDGKPTNAEVGAAHEYGTSKMPRRSFLRVPITDNLQKYLKASGLLDKKTLKRVIEEGSVREWMKQIGIVCERIVQEAFASGGFGKWKPLSPGYENETGQILMDTRQLRNSITSVVK